MNRRIVAFDLDGTLIANDSFVPFLLDMIKRHPSRWLQLWVLPFAVVWHKLGWRDNTWLKEIFLQKIVGGFSLEYATQHGERYSNRLAENLRQDALNTLREHQKRGDLLLLATASPDIYVQSLAQKLGFDMCVCTRLTVDSDGCLTGELAQGNCYGPNKLTQIQNQLQHASPDSCIDVAYSDHQADLPLLNAAKHAVVVSPKRSFLDYCRGMNIEVRQWN